MHNLRTKLIRLNKCKYSLYYSLLGEYHFENFILKFDQIQSDPFAPPSKITIRVPFEKTEFNRQLISNPIRMYSFCDGIARLFAKHLRIIIKEDKGSGNSGFCGIRYGGQKVIEGNSVLIKNDYIELKVLVGLPGFGRTIAAKEAEELFFNEIPELVDKSLIHTICENESLMAFVTLTERQHWLREECSKKGLVAFIANDSLLPRSSSISDKPMSNKKVRLFQSPKEFEESFTLPDGFNIKGMGIPKGVTLIVGAGFHGKSTLLSALVHGIYNHIGGDGREFCVTEENAVFLRSEDGRFIEGTNISPFIDHLPDYKSSNFFQTENASGSSSQAANLIESLEIGAKLILIDEDLSATNFLLRDEKMKQLVPDYKETITPLISHIQNLKEQGVSFIFVTGALGDFLSVADRVILADNYSYSDQTKKAHEIIKLNPVNYAKPSFFEYRSTRIIDSKSVNYVGKKGNAIIDGENGIVKFGRDVIDLRAWHHLYDYSQYVTIAAVIAYVKEKGYLDLAPEEIWEKVSHDIDIFGWDIFTYIGYNHLSKRQEERKFKQNLEKIEKTNPWRYIVKTRPLDWHAALCRLRSLKCHPSEKKKN